MPYFEILVILILLVLNGVFAMSELAIVSSKKVILRKKAEEGSVTAQRALDFAEDTGRFLPTVQIGITLIGILAGAFSGATLADYATDYLMQFGLSHERAEFISVSVIVVTVTYLTLIIGELVPKEMALRRPEAMALFVTPLIYRLSRLTWPIVWVLNKSSQFVLTLIRAGDKPETTVTQEEISALIDEGTGSGVFHENERDMLSGVMLLGDKPISAFIRPRIDVASLSEDATLADLKELMPENRYSRFPIRARDNENQILGVVHIKDILERMLKGEEFKLKDLIEEVMVFPDSAGAMTVLDQLSSSPVHLAVIIDEHGSFEGIVTLTDMLAIITGGINENGDEGEEFFRRGDGSWLMDGGILVEHAFEEIGLNEKHDDESFHTLAGFVLNYFRSIPKVGDLFDYNGYSFEVLDLDGHRIDKILIKKLD